MSVHDEIVTENINLAIGVLKGDWDFNIANVETCIIGACIEAIGTTICACGSPQEEAEEFLGDPPDVLFMPEGWADWDVGQKHIPRSKEDAIAALETWRDYGDTKPLWS